MEEKDMSTVVDGKRTGDVTESGNPNHSADGQFTEKGGSGSGESSSSTPTGLSESLKEKLQKRLTLKKEGPYYGAKIKFDEYSKNVITLKNFKQAAENNKRYRNVTPSIRPENIQILSNKLKDLFEKNECGMRISFKNLLSALRMNKFLNLHEAGTGGGCTNSEYRGEFSHSVFGSPSTTSRRQRYDFEKYGCLVSRGVAGSISRGMSEHGYGRCCVTFKKNDIKGRATYTLGDSLGNRRVIPSLIGGDFEANCFVSTYDAERVDSRIEKITKAQTPKQLNDVLDIPYTEIQYHGEMTFDNVSSVRIPDNYLEEEDFGLLLTFATQKNIPIYTCDFSTNKEYVVNFNENGEIVKEEVNL